MDLNNAEIAVSTQHLIDIKDYRDYWLHLSDYSDMGEERRLAYVALTRGRLRVTVTYCAHRRGFTKPSLFIEDLPAENVVHGWLHSDGPSIVVGPGNPSREVRHRGSTRRG